jgi:hypothetical protein
MRDRPLWALVAGVLATYPALALAWCVAMLLGTQPAAWRLGLAAGDPAVLASALLVAVGAVAMGGTARAAAAGLRHTGRFHRWVAGHEIPVPPGLAAVAAEVGLRGRLRLVAAAGQLAVTAGLARPYVVVSTGLVDALTGAELRAVLAHEQAHLRRRDPLRVLLARVLVAHLWFLPMAGDLRRRARHGYELAADRDAADRYGRSALAGALLRVVSPPIGVEAAAVTRFADPALLESRVSQLESGHPPRPAPVAAGRALLTVAGALAFVAVVAGGWSFMLVTCSSGILR